MKSFKKLTSLLLILCLLFCFTSCVTKDASTDGDTSGDNTIADDSTDINNELDADGDGFVDVEVVAEETPDDIDPDEADAFISYDFGAKFAVSFPFASTIEKVDYTNIVDLGEKIQEKAEAFSTEAGKNFVFFNDFEEDTESDLDQIVYAVGMQDNNETLDYLETGVYHNQADSDYVQYCVYISSNYYTIDDTEIDNFINFSSKYLGVTFDKEKLISAIEKALTEVKELEEVYVNQTKVIKGNGYTDKVALSVQSFEEENGNFLYYIDVDRERIYN